MARVNVGTISVDASSEVPVFFPPVILPSGVGYVFLLSTLPTNLDVDFLYFIPCPNISFAGLEIEIGCRYKWYPKGTIYSFVVPVYAAGAVSLPVTLGIIPIEIFKGRGSPRVVDITCAYEDTLTQPISFGL